MVFVILMYYVLLEILYHPVVYDWLFWTFNRDACVGW